MDINTKHISVQFPVPKFGWNLQGIDTHNGFLEENYRVYHNKLKISSGETMLMIIFLIVTVKKIIA